MSVKAMVSIYASIIEVLPALYQVRISPFTPPSKPSWSFGADNKVAKSGSKYR